MKIINKKNTLLILIVITLGVIGFYSFKTIKNERQYSISKNNISKIESIQKIEKLINKIQKEREYSSLYLGTEKNSIYKKLKGYRVETDIEFNKYKKMSKNERQVDIISLNLKKARVNTNKLDKDYTKIFYDNYHKIILFLLKEIKDIKTDQDNFNNLLYAIKTLNTLKENVNLGSSNNIYILTTQKKLNEKEIELYKKTKELSELPNYNVIKDENIRNILMLVLSKNKYNRIDREESQSIIENLKDGKYRITSSDWMLKIKEKNKKLYQIKKILMDNLNIKAYDEVQLKKQKLINVSVITLSLLGVLLFLVILFLFIAKDKKLFEETLKEISLLLNTEEQRELKSLIEERDLNRIYIFLIKTIKEANESKDLFLANMSHEIRTPLNGIVGFTQLLKEANLNDEEREYISIIEHSSDNLLSIVNSILDLSKIKANKIEIESIDFDPVKEFENMVESYVAKAEEKNINLNVFVDPTIPTKIVGDPTKISQIIVNLLSNAIKFTNVGGDVSIFVRKEQEDEKNVLLKFDVSDTGIGVTDEQKGKIFEEFSQADSSTSRKFGGTGLGLAISKNLVSLMGGHLSLDSILGEGTTFTFTLDMIKAEDSRKRVFNDLKGKTISFSGKEDDNLYNNISSYLFSMKTNLSKNEESEIHFINYNKETLQEDLDTPAKKILLISKNERDEIRSELNNIDLVVYKPIGLSKVTNAMRDVFSLRKEIIVEEKKDELYIFENLNILVAEDNTINQKLIKNLLNNFGLDPDIAENGKVAFEMTQNKSYDLIFMDIQMPTMGGVEATKKILTDELLLNKKESIIVALTANALQGDREKYLKVGMTDYLSKPLEIDKLNGILYKYYPNNIVK